MITAATVHLMGPQLLPPCMETGQPNAGSDVPPGLWSPTPADVDCPECLKWVHA